MPQSLTQKLRIQPDCRLLVFNAPAGFDQKLGKLPPGARILDKSARPDQVHWFVQNRAQLEKEFSRVMKLLRPGVTIWVYYPKGSSGMQTDLSRDKGWDCLMKEKDKLSWINLVSFDATWSVFGFRAKTEADLKKEALPGKEREILKWADSATKTIRLPVDLARALSKNKKLGDYFHSLAFSHKREYVEWIVTAKKDETRQKRIEGTLERLAKQWKNPRNL